MPGHGAGGEEGERQRDARAAAASAASAQTAARPASAVLSRCPARWRGSRAGPARSSTAATATIASPGAVVSSRRTAPASSRAASARPDDRQERHDARGQPRLRGQRADLGVDAAPLVEPARERAQQRGQVASGAQLERDRSCREARPLARAQRQAPRRSSSPAAARRPASANASPPRRRVGGGAASARSAVRPAPSSAATRRSASGSSRSSARSARHGATRRRDTARARASAARLLASAGARGHATQQRRGHAAALWRSGARRRARGTSCQPRPRRSTPWIETQPALAVAAARHLHDDVERRGDLLAHRGVRQLEPRHERQQLDPPERVVGALGVDGRERPVVPRGHRLEHVERLAATHLAHDQSVGPHPQRVAHELPDADLAACPRDSLRGPPGARRAADRCAARRRPPP